MNIALNINDAMHIFSQATPKCSHNTSACHKQKLLTKYLSYLIKMNRFGTSDASPLYQFLLHHLAVLMRLLFTYTLKHGALIRKESANARVVTFRWLACSGKLYLLENSCLH